MEPIDSNGATSLKEFWRAHVSRAQDFSGTAVEYCRANDLNAGTFYSYKRKFSVASKSTRPRKFVKVMPEPKESRQSLRPLLPDPKWLADFVSGVLKSR